MSKPVPVQTAPTPFPLAREAQGQRGALQCPWVWLIPSPFHLPSHPLPPTHGLLQSGEQCALLCLGLALSSTASPVSRETPQSRHKMVITCPAGGPLRGLGSLDWKGDIQVRRARTPGPTPMSARTRKGLWRGKQIATCVLPASASHRHRGNATCSWTAGDSRTKGGLGLPAREAERGSRPGNRPSRAGSSPQWGDSEARRPPLNLGALGLEPLLDLSWPV